MKATKPRADVSTCLLVDGKWIGRIVEESSNGEGIKVRYLPLKSYFYRLKFWMLRSRQMKSVASRNKETEFSYFNA